ncbi:MAG TPA: cytochrome C [Aggregicoccus sp.]|nr:cytochrome C [Aggregicoccus sp.]
MRWLPAKRAWSAAALAAAAGALLLPSSRVAAADAARPLALRAIMRDMGKNLQVITDGISREDWALVERTAPLLAEHPQPPLGEKMRLLGFLGSKAGAFRDYDGQVRQAAQALGRAAGRKDGEGAIASFAGVQRSCLGCHQRFRQPLVERFYGKR